MTIRRKFSVSLCTLWLTVPDWSKINSMAKAHRRAAIALGILLACCPCAFALDPSLDISQYAHTAWKVREGFFKGVIHVNCSDARRLSLAGHGIRLASLRWRSGRPVAAASG